MVPLDLRRDLPAEFLLLWFSNFFGIFDADSGDLPVRGMAPLEQLQQPLLPGQDSA